MYNWLPILIFFLLLIKVFNGIQFLHFAEIVLR